MRKVLHVGCGLGKVDETFSGWEEVRLDIDPSVNPDIVASITSIPVKDESFDGLFSSHNLEHLYSHEADLALREFKRVLKKDGAVLITLPNLQKICEYVANGNLEYPIYESPAGFISPIDVIYGYRPYVEVNSFMAHKTGFTPGSLRNALKRAGFKNININALDLNLWAIAQ